MALRWAATGLLATEKQFRRIVSYRELWTLKAVFDKHETGEQVAAA
jgi:hypothetical protein